MRPGPERSPSALHPTRAVEERSFKGSSRHLALLFAVAYCTWLLVVRQRFGKVGSHMLFDQVLRCMLLYGCCPACSCAAAATCLLTARHPRPCTLGMPSTQPHAPHRCATHSPHRCASLPPPLQFPYPILNNLPFPLGYASFVLLGFVVVLFAFHLGKAVKTLLGGNSGSGGSSAGGGKNGSTRRRRSSSDSEKPKDQ